MENAQTLPQIPMSTAGFPSLFPNFSASAQFPCTSLFPAIAGFPPAFMTRPDMFFRPFLTDHAKMQNHLALSLANQSAAYNSPRTSPDEPPKKLRRATTEGTSSENECPCCNQILKSAAEYTEHLNEERQLLGNSFRSLKNKIMSPTAASRELSSVSPKIDPESSIIELSEDAKESPSADTDPIRTAKTRYDTFTRIKDGQQNRIQGKLSAYRLYRGERSETPSGESKRAPSNASSRTETPLASSETDNVQITGRYSCKLCQKSNIEYKTRGLCGHVLCAECWNNALSKEIPHCLICLSAISSSSELSEVFL